MTLELIIQGHNHSAGTGSSASSVQGHAARTLHYQLRGVTLSESPTGHDCNINSKSALARLSKMGSALFPCACRIC